MSNFPIKRLRRLRKSEKIRDLVKEVSLSPKDLICPVFVEEGIQTKKQIQSMPAIERLPLSDVVNEVDAIADLGIPAVMLFGIPQNKDNQGTSAFVFETKDFDFGNPGLLKRPKKIIFSYTTEASGVEVRTSVY